MYTYSEWLGNILTRSDRIGLIMDKYTIYFKNGTKEIVPGDLGVMSSLVKRDSRIAFAVKGVREPDRYVFKAGMWTVTSVSEEGENDANG